MAPVGEPLTDSLADLLESKGRFTQTGIERIMIAEVIEPAILYRGEILATGKVITAIPASSAEEKDADQTEPRGAYAAEDNPVNERNDENE